MVVGNRGWGLNWYTSRDAWSSIVGLMFGALCHTGVSLGPHKLCSRLASSGGDLYLYMLRLYLTVYLPSLVQSLKDKGGIVVKYGSAKGLLYAFC